MARNPVARLVDAIGRLGADPADDGETALKKRLLVWLAVGPTPFGIAWGLIYISAGVVLGGLIPIAYALVAIPNTILFAATRNFPFFRFTQLLLILLLPWAMMLSLGGFAGSGVVVIWSALCPLMALLVESRRRATLWFAAFAALLVAAGLLQPFVPPVPLADGLATPFFVLNLTNVTGITFFLLRHFVHQRDFFQERSETLLLNILPREISEALKARPGTIASHHADVSILFADVVGFTKLSTTLAPMDLLRVLDEVFHCFDQLVERYGVEKIKTIGDCYMVAAGVPVARPDHAAALVGLALDMTAAVAGRSFGGCRLAFRIGVNSGPVVAGVIGRKKFIYDLWGDAVNLASRMESQGESGAVQITRATCDLVGDAFVCEPRGVVEIKGGGTMEVWHVTGRREGREGREP